MLGIAALAAWWLWTDSASASRAAELTADGADGTLVPEAPDGPEAPAAPELDLAELTEVLTDGVVIPLLDTVTLHVVEPVVDAVGTDVAAVGGVIDTVVVDGLDTLVTAVATTLTGDPAGGNGVGPGPATGPDAGSGPTSGGHPSGAGHGGIPFPLVSADVAAGPSVLGELDSDMPARRWGRVAVVAPAYPARATTADAPFEPGAARSAPAPSPRSTAPTTTSGPSAERHDRGPLYSTVLACLAALVAALTVRATPVVVALVDGFGTRPPTTPD